MHAHDDAVTWRDIRNVWALTIAAYWILIVGGAHLIVKAEGWLNALLTWLRSP